MQRRLSQIGRIFENSEEMMMTAAHRFCAALVEVCSNHLVSYPILFFDCPMGRGNMRLWSGKLFRQRAVTTDVAQMTRPVEKQQL